MLWEIEIHPAGGVRDANAERVLTAAQSLGVQTVQKVRTARSFLIESNPENWPAPACALDSVEIRRLASALLADTVVESFQVRVLPQPADVPAGDTFKQVTVIFKPGVTDCVAESARDAAVGMGFSVCSIRTCQKYWFNATASAAEVQRVAEKLLSNAAIQQVLHGPLTFSTLAMGAAYRFERVLVPIRDLDDAGLQKLSKTGQLYLSLAEMQTIKAHFQSLGREPTDIELETIAQTWSEHCSHKTLRGRVQYRDHEQTITFNNLLKETVFAATATIRERLGADDWCVSVFQDNAGVVRFDETQHVCIKVETHNHPSAIEPYGGANTGLGGVIRDPLGTGLGAKPLFNTDVFCFAPPTTSHDGLPPGVLHPRSVAMGVVAGVRDYGNRMGIPTVNGAIFFDDRYLGNPLVFCGNVAMLPVGCEHKAVQPGDLIVAVGGRTGRDGIHGATFSSSELTQESEFLSGGAVQIGNAITEKMVQDVVLQARDRKLYTAITDCGAGGFSSAVGEMGAETGARVALENAPLKYEGLSYTEIWISEAQERMVLSVPPGKWDELRDLCAGEGVEAAVLGEFTNTGKLELTYRGEPVGELSMHFLHEGRPPVVRDAVYQPAKLGSGSQAATLRSNTNGASAQSGALSGNVRHDDTLRAILGSWNVCSKEWVIRQYDHEVQAGSVIKPLVGAQCDGPSDAAIVRPNLRSQRGLVIACGMNPRFGDLDPYWMAAGSIDEAIRNCVAVGADPQRIAILDNFCWGNTERPETLGSLVRAALGCRDAAIAFGTPFVSGKDSLNNEFAYTDSNGQRQNVAIPPSLLITALGQIADVRTAVTMDLKSPGNALYLVGETLPELGGSHWELVTGSSGGAVPKVNFERASRIFTQMNAAMTAGRVRSVHDCSEGGLAAAIAEMAMAGGLGAEIALSLTSLSNAGVAAEGIPSEVVALFSESHSRFVVEVEPSRAADFERGFEGLPIQKIGTVISEKKLTVRSAEVNGVLVDSSLEVLRTAWKSPLAWA